jgi:hypothetical protein
VNFINLFKEPVLWFEYEVFPLLYVLKAWSQAGGVIFVGSGNFS